VSSEGNQEQVEVQHDKQALHCSCSNDLVHNLEQGEALKFGVGSIVDASWLGVFENQVELEGHLTAEVSSCLL